MDVAFVSADAVPEGADAVAVPVGRDLRLVGDDLGVVLDTGFLAATGFAGTWARPSGSRPAGVTCWWSASEIPPRCPETTCAAPRPRWGGLRSACARSPPPSTRRRPRPARPKPSSKVLPWSVTGTGRPPPARSPCWSRSSWSAPSRPRCAVAASWSTPPCAPGRGSTNRPATSAPAV